MQAWVDWAMGPAFRFALAFLVLGLIRHVALTIWEINRAVRRAGDPNFPWKKLFVETVKWLVPIQKIGHRLYYGLTTFPYHIGVIIVPLFLAGHIALVRETLHISWPAIPRLLADALTLVVLLATVAIILERALARDSRAISRFSDYAIPIVVAVPFLSGFLMMHPSMNPMPFMATMFIHVMSVNLLFVLIPLTKLSHMVLLPTVQVITEVAWHFTPDGGAKVAVALGKENEPV